VDQHTRPGGDATRVVVAHGSAAGRYALRLLIDAEPGIDMVAAATQAIEGGRLARDHDADVLVLSEQLLAEGRPGVMPASCAVVVLGLEDHPAAAAAAKARGARHYVLWDRAAEDLPPVLRGAGSSAVRGGLTDDGLADRHADLQDGALGGRRAHP
jgi:DNA-binding NarL/FixJ family response regulator